MESIHALDKSTSADALPLYAIVLRLECSTAPLLLTGFHYLLRSPRCLAHIRHQPFQQDLMRLQRSGWEKTALIAIQQLRNPAQLHALVKQSNNPISRFRQAFDFQYDKDLDKAHKTWLQFASYKQKELQFLNAVKTRAKPSDGKLDRKKQKLEDANVCLKQKAAFDGHVNRPSGIHAEI
jgi:hypothetical protein